MDEQGVAAGVFDDGMDGRVAQAYSQVALSAASDGPTPCFSSPYAVYAIGGDVSLGRALGPVGHSRTPVP